MNDTSYVGMRYVPVFAEPSQWDISRQYENLMMVTNEGETYISKEFVPTGVELTNEDYWVQISVPGGSTSGGVNYSTEEQDTGLKWTDGRTIYQKTYVEQMNNGIRTGWQSLNYSIFGGNYELKTIKSEIVYQKINNTNPGYSCEWSGIFGIQTYYDGSAPQLYSPVAIDDGGFLKVTLFYTKASDTPTN